MADKNFSRRNLDFILYEMHDVLSLTHHQYFNMHDKETFTMTIDAAAGIAAKKMHPAFAESDRNPPELIDGTVKVHPLLHEYYKAYCEAGLMSSVFSSSLEGQQLPEMIFAATELAVGSAHNGFQMYTSLSNSAARLIVSFGSEYLIDTFASRIIRGDWTGTMCLTETHAGSSLSDIQTLAYPRNDGTYNITGQKIFISAGDHDITENIVHLVLARVEGAPGGVKGISLFVVPKKRIQNDSLVSNDVTSIGIYHKMGQRCTPAMHLEFGGNGDCIGYLVGEVNHGLAYMFRMMNDKRLTVGLSGIYIASAAYCASLQYAKERKQGRRLNNKYADEPSIPIINHPDVRRMLLFQKAIVEGGLGLLMQCYKYLDMAKISETAESKQYYNDLLELLTPVAKTFGAEMGIVAVNNGLQVLGGYGYTEDFPLEQMARDVRIMSLYEGTTGIQSLALLGRHVPANKSRALVTWKKEVIKDLEAAQAFGNIQCYADWLSHEITQFEKLTAHLLQINANGDKEIFLADANLYMELFGILNIAWQWLKQGTIAQKSLSESDPGDEEKKFYRSKIHSMKFYFHYELPKIKGLNARLMDTEVLTVLKDEDLIM